MRQITVRLADYVEEQKRRDRHAGRVVAAVAIVAGLVIAMSGKNAARTTPPNTGTSSTTAPSAPAQIGTWANLRPFGPLLAGTSSAAQLVRLRNDGGAPLTIGRIAATRSAFHVTNDCGQALAPHESCSVAIVFTPSTAGKESAVLNVESNGGPATLVLEGEATAIPAVDLGPTDLGRATVGSAAERVVRFLNSGPLPVAIDKATAAPPFEVSAACGTVPPGGSCEVGVVFRPAANGPAAGELMLVNAHGDVVAKSALTGSGVALDLPPPPPPQVPIVIVEPREINFLGDPGTKRIVVRNNGQLPVQLSVKPEAPSRYGIDAKDCEARPLQAGGQCAIVVNGLVAVRLGAATRIVISYAGGSQVVPVFARR
jgi:hypothetical protein